MRRLLLLSVFAVTLALPAAAHAAGITASCTSAGVTAACDSSHWYRADVTVVFSLPAGSNPLGCATYTISADTTGDTRRCTIDAGSGCCLLDVTIKRDATAPTIDTLAAARAPDANGWYNHAVAVSGSGSDATSGIASCTSTTYSGPDAGSASVTGTCTDNAGNVSSAKALTISYDATPPTVTPAPARGADANGWYNHAVSVAFQGSDPASGIDSCTSGAYSGPDTGSAAVAGSCKDKAGNVANGSFGLQYDATAPTVTGATPARAPDLNGWYNHAVTIDFAGSDSGSGLASCDEVEYSKPDAADASVSGRCRDNAGNESAPLAFALKYDSKPPALTKLMTTSTGSSVALAWSASTDVARVAITRTRAGGAPVTLYNGKRITSFTDKKVQNGARYSYQVTGFDQAGNDIVVKSLGTPASALIAPRASAHVRAGTVLRWRPVKSAGYYNVQLWLKGKKVLTTWPKGTTLRLPRLRAGTYLWLVWPGIGDRSAHKYGPLLGKSSFVITR
jgi:hypothetical protein